MNITPMLAKVFNPDQAQFPYLAQPKLDGVRCLATREGLFTRTGKRITGFTRIEAETAEILRDQPNIQALDGEIYHHDMKFDEISGILRKGEDLRKDDCYLFVFDYVSGAFSTRHRLTYLERVIQQRHSHLIRVPTDEIKNQHELDDYLEFMIAAGYEGVMLRDPNGLYEQKRSANLLKLKKFHDSEFEITGTLEGTGKETGLLIWQCKTPAGETFTVRPEGSYEEREKMLAIAKRKPHLYVGQQLTVRYQELTPKGIPRFPVAVGIRNYE